MAIIILNGLKILISEMYAKLFLNQNAAIINWFKLKNVKFYFVNSKQYQINAFSILITEIN